MIGDASLKELHEVLKEKDVFNVLYTQDIYSNEYWLEVMCKDVSKANAILEYAKLENYEQIVCFGDSLNDISMFEVSDVCYAVSNAHPSLKKKRLRSFPQMKKMEWRCGYKNMRY